MSYVDPKLRYRFESLPIELKNEILRRDVSLYTLNDLIECLQSIVEEELALPPLCHFRGIFHRMRGEVTA